MLFSHETWGLVAGAVALVFEIAYVASIFAGDTRPTRSSWAIWSILSVLIYVVYYEEAGSEDTLIYLAVYTASPVIVFLLSLKFGQGGFEAFDIAALVGAGLTMVVWIHAGAGEALVLFLIIDICGLVPMLANAWRDPSSEDWRLWAGAAVAAQLDLFAINDWSFNNVSYPMYFVIADMVLTWLFLRSRWQEVQEVVQG